MLASWLQVLYVAAMVGCIVTCDFVFWRTNFRRRLVGNIGIAALFALGYAVLLR